MVSRSSCVCPFSCGLETISVSVLGNRGAAEVVVPRGTHIAPADRDTMADVRQPTVLSVATFWTCLHKLSRARLAGDTVRRSSQQCGVVEGGRVGGENSHRTVLNVAEDSSPVFIA